MKYTLVPIGSAGDVFPFLGLALLLRERGHQVTLITNGHFAPLVQSHRIPFIPFGDAAVYRQAIEDPNLFHPHKGLKTALSLVADQRLLLDLIRDNTPADGVVIAHTLAFAARILEDAGERRVISLALQPAVLRSLYRGSVYFGRRGLTALPRWMQRSLFFLIDRLVVDPMLNPMLDPLRDQRGLPKVRRYFNQWIHSPRCSIALFPEWYGPRQPDWPASLSFASFPLSDDVARQPASRELLAQVEQTRPIVFTFGSGFVHGHNQFQAASDACVRLNRPGLLLTPHREQIPKDLPPLLRHADFAPLSQILPHCAALVHHGGIGTTAAGIAAGIPQIICPLAYDQPDNASRIHDLQLGERLFARHFTAPKLAALLDETLKNPRLANQCGTRAQQLARVDPMLAASLVEQMS